MSWQAVVLISVGCLCAVYFLIFLLMFWLFKKDL